MRKHHLLTATAVGLALSAFAGTASAATTISTATTSAVSTSTTGDLNVDTGGSITLTSGNAITVDSDNTVVVNGSINMSASSDNSTAILINGGHTSGLATAGSIIVTDNYTASDTVNTDAVADGPFAQGTGRYGIHSTGATPFIGNVSLNTGTTIQVEGNQSYGVVFDNSITGNFTTKAAITQQGDDTVGIWLKNGVTGNTYLSGSIAGHGSNARAVVLNGAYTGLVNIDGSYSTSGYATTSPTGLTADQVTAILATPADMYQSGATVTLAGTFAQGVRFSTSVTDSDTTNTDEDGNGIVDTDQQSSSIAAYGTAPGLLIGSSTTATTLSPLTYTTTGIQAPTVKYGLLLQGSITAAGVYSGFTSKALQVGDLGQAVTISNGMGITGTVSSSSSAADTISVSIGNQATVPAIDILGGSITASTGSVTTSTTTNSVTTYATVGQGAKATAIDIGAGATVNAINITKSSGGVYANATGSTTKAVAIADHSGTLNTIVNDNVISAVITASDDNGDGVADTLVNRPVAIDVSANTSGVSITQNDLAPTDDTIAAPLIYGDILLGSGNDSITVNGGSVTGNIDFGAGANSFTMTGSSAYIGKMTGTGTVALDIGTGTAALLAGSKLNLTTLHVGSTGTLGIVLDTTNPTQPVFTGTGPATFDNGATFKLALNDIVLTPQTYTVLTASSINLGNISTSLEGEVPYLYAATLSTGSGNTVLSASFRLKTQAEGKFSNNEYAALLPVLTAARQDAGATTSLMAATDKPTFDGVYNQYLPNYSGESLLTLSRGTEALTQELGALTLVPDNNGGQYWLQEYGFKTTRKYGETAGFDATGFAFSGGRETAMGPHNMLGVYISYTTASPADSFAIAREQLVNSDLTIGGYWRMNTGAFKGWAHAGAGYAQFDSTRELLTAYVSHVATAKWNGFSYSAGAGASYDYKAGAFAMTPQISASLYGLKEQKYAEAGGTDYFDLNVADRDSNIATASALLNFSYRRWFVIPEVWVGYKQNVSAKIADTVANFAGGTAFTLNGGDVTGGGPTAGFRISSDNQYSYFALEGDYAKLNGYTDYSVSLRTRFQF
ncbi:autotransporter domain-containing protein [Asticcacaulis solisilvae]|uniref:autotransporter domain-containing protein n=1 Tax=Asticcacaulis solisilvae TaxID=1217274 RepID=UPI003FD7A711